MNKRALGRFAGLTATVVLAAISVASAGPGGGGGHGGGHGSGGGHGFFGSHSGHGGRGAYGWRNDGRGGYGWRGYGRGYGSRGGYYGCCGWGWGLGFYVPFLPWYYDTYWWGEVPYYYADGNYYLWDSDAGAYETVEPPQTLTHSPPIGSSPVQGAPVVSPQLFAYPKAGQSEAQQKQDKEECARWAAGQSGASAPVTPAQPGKADAGSDPQAYLRAEAACLEARNYSVR
ncbi:MAG TPA: hypothetical protein VKQ31_09720 [Steroidobacteraceae bacterium]|nr:hypothetical protein [Steroidobacteraceae bacterium]